jgi:putative hydrolase of the HAD superfamily
MAGYQAVAREVWGSQSGQEEAVALRLAARSVWEREAPCPEYRARVHLGASDGLSASFDGDDPALDALRAFLPRFRAEAFDGVLPDSWRGSGAALVDIWVRARFEAQTVFTGARELLSSLAERTRLGLVTNGPSDLQRKKLAATELGSYFDVVVASGDLGIGKPHREIFDAALGALGVAASDALMVGNDRQRDIEGAQAAGLRTVWAQPGGAPEDGAVADLRTVGALVER